MPSRNAGDLLECQQSHGTPLLAISHLLLSNFRSYASAEINLSGRPVVLTGANGAGKTNILDAISLLSPGRGLRGATLSDHAGRRPAPGDGVLWAISATLVRDGESYEIGTGLLASATGAARHVRLNGAAISGSAGLSELVQMVWLTPSMDRLFIESASGRRRFLDRLVLALVPDHARAALRYEQAMRERARLLRYGPRDPAWLDGLEAQMAESGVALSLARMETVSRLNAALQERSVRSEFPAAQLRLEGEIDKLAAENGASIAQDVRDRLARLRLRDAETGRTHFGPHASDLVARDTAKRSDARHCSTGEQKALLISVVLAHARELSHITKGIAPILLLDEIAAHLDASRRAALFEEVLALGAQAWITGTDAQMFRPLRGKADWFEIQDSRIHPTSE